MLVSSSPKTSTYDHDRIMDEAAVRLKAQVASVSVKDDPTRGVPVDGLGTDGVEPENARSGTAPANAGHSNAAAPLAVSTNAAAPTTPIETSSLSSNRMFRQLYLACAPTELPSTPEKSLRSRFKILSTKLSSFARKHVRALRHSSRRGAGAAPSSL